MVKTMKITRIICTLTVLLCLGLTGAARAELVTPEEAELVAANWIDAAVTVRGAWGTAQDAQVSTVDGLSDEDGLLGYVCNVEPEGFVLVTALKGLAPVKAWSDRGTMRADCTEGLCAVLRFKLRQARDYVEGELGPAPNLTTGSVGRLLGHDLSALWEEVLLGRQDFHQQIGTGLVGQDYVQGEELIESQWHQGPPYNNDCPNHFCSYPNHCNYNMNAVAGCVAIAGSQIMRHWHWPPQEYWGYDWLNVLDEYDPENGCDWDPVTVDAVAHLVSTTGELVGMDYGCDGSSATHDMMLLTYGWNFFHEAVSQIPRSAFTQSGWFDIIAAELDNNQVMQYAVTLDPPGEDPVGHSMVLDGYNRDGNLYHFHYGWGPQAPGACWFAVDQIPDSVLEDESMLENIYPAMTMPGDSYGQFPVASIPYRYVSKDTYGHYVDILGGQDVQFFPGTVLHCVEDYVKIRGSSPTASKVFSRADKSNGIAVWSDGVLAMYEEGGIRIY
ncbi:MAG: hypothetical protein GF330_04490 [Candidatus Eisenbacteria bacterium]|nr:hypothetical protein [Candidatus Eisenbacteria bacterium]